MAFTINDAKEAGVTRMPVHLFDFSWPDGATLSVCSHPLSKGGTDYLDCVLDQKIDPVQALSPTGIEIPPSVTLTLADADKSFADLDAGRPFLGARLVVTFAYCDMVTGEWSSDSLFPFVGRCDEPQITDDTFVVSAGFILNLEAKQEPSFQLQPRCPKIKPRTADQVALKDVEGSLYFACGSGTTADCGHQQGGCAVENDPLRFGGQTFEIPPASKSREFTSGNWLTDLVSDPNGAKSGDFVPLVFGTAWVDALRLGSWPEGNSTRGEAICCEGRPEAILQVVVADETLPASNDLDGNPFRVEDPLLRYDVVSSGDRTGRLNPDTPWNGAGDPHGSQCTIEWVVYHKLTATLPTVRVLLRGPKVHAYAPIDSIVGGVATLANGATNEDIAGNAPFTVRIFGNSNAALNGTFGLTSWAAGPPGTVTLTGTAASGTGGYIEYLASSDRYAWVILRLLTRAGLALEDVDVDAFATANRSHRTAVNYTLRDGSPGSHPKYTCSLVVRQRRSTASILTGLLRGCTSHLGRNPATGKVGLFARGTIAMEQPAPIDGSNYNTAVASGYLAYHFDERAMVDDRTRLTRQGRASGSVANLVTVGFANEENDYSGDSVAVTDPDEIARRGQEVPGSIAVDGCNALDRANRVGAIFLAEQIGGKTWRFVTTAKAAKLRVGHLIGISNVKHSFDHTPFRTQQIAPSANSETTELLATEHDDAWYADDFTSQAGNPSQAPRRDRLARPAFAWSPYQAQPAVGDPLYARTEWTFGLRLIYTTEKDGKPAPVALLTGRMAVNEPVNLLPPVIGKQGTTASMGGTLAGDGAVYIVVIAAKDSDGRPGPISAPCHVVVAQIGTTNTITIPVSFLDPAGDGYYVWAGRNASRLAAIDDAGFAGSPSTITITDIPEATWGAPDTEFDQISIRPRLVRHSGLFEAGVAAVAMGTIQITGAGWPVDQWAGYDCEIQAKADGSELPVLHFRVASNTADTLTLTPDPLALGVAVGDLLAMLSKPTVAGLVVSDANWMNTLSGGGGGLAVNEEKGSMARAIAGPGRGHRYPIASNTATSLTLIGPWITPWDSTTRYVIEEASELPTIDTAGQANSDPTAVMTLQAELANYAGRVVLLEVVTLDGGGNESAVSANPVRMLYVAGEIGEAIIQDAIVQVTY